jgi:type IV pilus assembly protein PilB
VQARSSNLSEILLAKGFVGADELLAAEREQRVAHRPLGRVLLDRQAITETQLMSARAEQMSLEFVDLRDQPVDAMVASLVPDAIARSHGIIPIGLDEHGRLRLAMSDPTNVVAMDDVRTITDRAVVPVVATHEDVLAAIDQLQGASTSVEQVAGDLDVEDETAAEVGQVVEADEAPIVRFVNAIIQQAVGARASDIHIEPGEREVGVRFRIDGVLHPVTSQRRSIHAGVVSRLKIMADMDIAERRVPQDGRISLRAGSKLIDLRVSTLPTVHGEKVVLRVLDKTTTQMRLSDLGFLEHNYAVFERNYRKPYGMILVTGPTGSGKSTTLYATVNALTSPDVNVVTTEDPVEYQIPGINQVQINTRAGLTFPVALRSILRQDPDIVLVGEMRDQETARIGMEAALTGHLVLSTLHTNDAPSAVTRLVEMDIDRFLVGSAVDCVLAQRLARSLCESCREPYRPTGDQLRTAGLPWQEDEPVPTLWRAVGCRRCRDTGYHGRVAIHEVMEVSEPIAKLIVSGGTTDQIREVARHDGMLSLREDGLAKVLMGHTTLEEIARVVA